MNGHRLSITHVITGLNVGGAERALYALLTGGLEGDFRNRIVSLMGEGHYGALLREAGIPVVCLNLPPGRLSLTSILRLRSIISAEKPNIVQGWMYHGNLFGSLARFAADSPMRLCWNVRTSLEAPGDMSWSTRFALYMGRFWSSRPDRIIYNSARSRTQHEVFGFRSENSIVLPNAIDTLRWRPSVSKRSEVRRKLGYSDDSRLLGFVGRNHSAKDPLNFFLACRRVLAAYPGVHVVLVGRDLDNAVPTDLPRDRVRLLGERSDVPDLMPAFDLLCLSSKAEGFPNVLGEAMACGLPCVTTDVGDAAEIVGDTGWTAPPRDSVALAEKLLTALALPKEDLYRRGEAARRRIECRYSVGSVVDRYAALYHAVAVGEQSDRWPD
ncbi:glycosyltransferase involved in cell wall biosynthesis [Constrictibacter sp. MBR-5]|uniref:glycosyltransferase family 4 protein n=1 Tax=Constrictibacter sp. MBR-5 TaxID=3156467 RepID=UPI0033999FDA